MKAIIPSYQRAESISTPYLKALENFEIIVLVHNKKELAEYKKHNPTLKIICTDIDVELGGGLPRQRKWAIENLLQNDEWLLFADDNIKSIYGVDDTTWIKESILEKNEDNWGDLNSKQFFDRVDEISKHADYVGAYHVGFLPAHNYYFARKKYREYGFCMGKMTMWKKDINFNWNGYYTNSIEDFNHTAMHLVNYGKVLIVDYLFPLANHYSAGGIGNKKSRKQARIESINIIMHLYPNLFRKKKRPDYYPDMSVKQMSKENFIKWRYKYLEFVKHYEFDLKEVKWKKTDKPNDYGV